MSDAVTGVLVVGGVAGLAVWVGATPSIRGLAFTCWWSPA
jgi:hypothetical protein